MKKYLIVVCAKLHKSSKGNYIMKCKFKESETTKILILKNLRCRSATAPYFDDDFAVGERAARDADGKTYYVPGDMSYKEWKNFFINGNEIELLNDVTQHWVADKRIKGSVSMADKYIFNGEEYRVDGRHVVLNPSPREKEIAQILAEVYGKNVIIEPKINYPQGIQTPDYTINGDGYDLKEPVTQGKNTLYNLISKKKKQAQNFIIDVSSWGIARSEMNRQIRNVLLSEHTRFVKKIVVVDGTRIIKVLNR